jgi:hypothetical protein
VLLAPPIEHPIPPPVAPPAAHEDAVEEIDDPEKEEAIQMLIHSASFNSTHAAVSRLSYFRSMLRRSDAERLIQAAVNNVQIRWIATDSDVYAFFASVLTDHSDIDAELFEEAVDVFGLRPDPVDPLDAA